MSKDSDLFKKAMENVQPLKHQNRHPLNQQHEKKPVKLQPKDFEEETTNTFNFPLSDNETVSITAEQYLSYAKPNLPARNLKKLKFGKFPIEARLDLHGYNIEQAREILLNFLMSSYEEGLRHLQIIHGKGLRGEQHKPILKIKTYHWLRQIEFVLAFYSCLPKDGGTGAVYVLLKNARKAHSSGGKPTM